MGMTKKTKFLTLRISPEQYKNLLVTIQREHQTKSEVVRDALNDYMDGNKRPSKNSKNEKIKT